MATDLAVKDQERNVQAASDLLDVMQEHQMEFVIRQNEGSQHVDVHIHGCTTILCGGRGGINATMAEQIFKSHITRLGQLNSE